MCFDVFMYLRDFSRFFHFFFFTNYADPVSVCVVLYVIILIQILIKYNVKNLITACTRWHSILTSKLKNLPTLGGGTPPSQTLPPLGRFAPSHLSLFHSVPPPPPMRWPTVRHCVVVSLKFELNESIIKQYIKHLFHTFFFFFFLLLFRFKSKCGCPISSKITKLYFISNIIQLPRG